MRPAGSTAATAWRPLAAGASLGPGDQVQAGSGAVELALASGTVPPEEAAVLGHDRIVLAAGARATFAPGPAFAASVEAGEVFASARATLALQVGAATIALDRADAALAVAKTGTVDVVALAGRVQVQVSGKSVDLEGAQRVAIDRNGHPGKVIPGADAPHWLASARAIDPARILLSVRGGAADSKAPALLVGERQGDAIRGGTTARKGPGTKIVCTGRGVPEGFAVFELGLRLRVRYRLPRSVPLGLQITETGHGRNFQAVVAAPRAGVWTELDFDLGQLVDEAKSGAQLAPGDRLDILTLSAHGEDPELVFEVGEITLYRR